MDEQHRYEINLKKDELYIQLSSDDVYFISQQMDKWFRILLDDSYVPVSYPKAQAAPEPPPPAPAPAPEPPPPPPPAPEPEPAPQPEPPPPPPPAPEPEPPQQATLPLSEPEPEPQAQPMPAPPPLDEHVENDFEAVMDSLMKDLGDEGPAEEASAPYHAATVSGGDGNGKPAGETPLDLIDSLSELCDRSHATSLEDFLLLSAYYLTYFEGQEKFSLKRINSMLVKSGLTPVNHSVLESMLARGYLSMVPDLTGTAEVSEYVLTEDGQHYANKLL